MPSQLPSTYLSTRVCWFECWKQTKAHLHGWCHKWGAVGIKKKNRCALGMHFFFFFFVLSNVPRKKEQHVCMGGVPSIAGETVMPSLSCSGRALSRGMSSGTIARGWPRATAAARHTCLILGPPRGCSYHPQKSHLERLKWANRHTVSCFVTG